MPIASEERPPVDEVLAIDFDEENREVLAEFQAEAVEHLQQIENALLILDRRPDDAEALHAIFRSFHTIKGNAGFLGLAPMHTLAHEVEGLLDLVRNGRLRLTPAIVTEILRSRDALQALNQQVGAALEQSRLPDRIIPVGHLIAAVRRLAGGTEGGGPEPAPAMTDLAEVSSGEPYGNGEPDREADAAPGGPDAVAIPESGVPAPPQTVRVSTEKLDALMDMVGELVIMQSQLTETARLFGKVAPPLVRNVGRLNRVIKELQDTAMLLRMIPIRPTFQKMERLVRDLAQTCGKKAVFTTSGGDTELDRIMVEEIADPLVHMVRNSLDHGLELPAERIARGKPEAGAISLRASPRGSEIVIELQDDGCGLNVDKILAKARRQGLVSEDARPTPAEIQHFIFLPGFSTADKVTAVSGRGVGMDVVKRNVEKLGGRIEIASEPGKGSTFTIRLPLTVATIDGLVMRVGEERFILPSSSVLRVLRPAPGDISEVEGRGEMIDHSGDMLTVHRLYRYFGIPARAESPWEGVVVIVESLEKTYALLVDEIVSEQEVVIKSLGSSLPGLSGVAGGAVLGDGDIALILDPDALWQAA